MAQAFTLVTTVFNEASRLEKTIEDLESQTLKPNQIIIVDAGSKDGTWEILEEWKQKSTIDILPIQWKGCNIAEGRNHAIEKADHDLIASTDFGCRYHERWLESIITPFDNPTVQVVAGNYTVRLQRGANQAQKADYILQNDYRVCMDEYFVPSSRSIAYYKQVWKEVGGYPEWLSLAADDSTFAYLVKKRYSFTYIDKPYVYWGRHNSYKAFGKEAYRYGLGEGETRYGFKNFVSNVAETLFRYSIPIHVICIAAIGWFPWLSIPLFIIQSFGLRSYLRAIKQWRGSKLPRKILNLFACFKMIEICRWNNMKGYIKGYWGSPDKSQEAKALQQMLKEKTPSEHAI